MLLTELIAELQDWWHADGDQEVLVRVPGEEEPVPLRGVSQDATPPGPRVVLEPEKLLSEEERAALAARVTELKATLERDTLRRNARAGSMGG